MAKGFHKRHTELTREKIRVSVCLDTLHKAVEGELELSATRLGAINALLDRALPKLAQIQHTGDSENPVRVEFEWMNRPQSNG